MAAMSSVSFDEREQPQTQTKQHKQRVKKRLTKCSIVPELNRSYHLYDNDACDDESNRVVADNNDTVTIVTFNVTRLSLPLVI